MPPSPEAVARQPAVRRLHIGLVVCSMDWHARVLTRAFMALGAASTPISLKACGLATANPTGLAIDGLEPWSLGAALPDAIVVRDMDRAFEKLRALKVQFVSTGPQTLPASIKAAAGIKAFYFRDPDQHNLEIIYFPPGKGDPRWQEKTDKLFLGIDHTAIGISNTDASLRFYRDFLGLRKAGESENFGTEQEHLNQVFGAHLRITGMRSDSGPGVEFLEYLTPRDGRARPADIHANDIVDWQTMIVTDNLDSLANKLQNSYVRFVSPGIVIMQNKAGFSKGAPVSDPDGHDVLLIQK